MKTLLGDCQFVHVEGTPQKPMFDLEAEELARFLPRYPKLAIPNIFHWKTFRGEFFFFFSSHNKYDKDLFFSLSAFSQDMKKEKVMVGAVAPSILRVLPDSAVEERRDVILLGIWKTRCKTGRVDIIVWLPWMLPEHRIKEIHDGAARDYLFERSCVVDEEYDLTQPLE